MYDEIAYQNIDSEDNQEQQFFDRFSEGDMIKMFDLFLDFMEKKYKIKCPE